MVLPTVIHDNSILLVAQPQILAPYLTSLSLILYTEYCYIELSCKYDTNPP